jgi:hypothetical protein
MSTQQTPVSGAKDTDSARQDSTIGGNVDKSPSYYGHFVARDRNWLGVLAKRRIAQHIVNLAELPEHAAIFELGPGDGVIAELVTRSGHSYRALDASAAIAANLRIRGFDVSHGFAPPLPDDLGRVDAVFALHVIEHMRDIATASEFLAAVRDRLTEHGRVILATPDYARWGVHFYDSDYTHCLPFTARRLRQTVEAVGLEVLHQGLQVGPLFGYTGVPFAWMAKRLYTATLQDLLRWCLPKDIAGRGFLTILPNLVLLARKRNVNS